MSDGAEATGGRAFRLPEAKATTPAPGAREAAGSGADRGGAGSIRGFAFILTQLLVLLLVIHRFQIENEAFFRLAGLTTLGFGVHYILPLRHRLPFFAALSLTGLAIVLGLEQAAWLLGLGLVMIGIAHLPVRIGARVAILGGVGLGLAFARWGMPRYQLGEVPWSAAIWPIFGSMFVFRLMVYMYDLKHGAGPTRLSQTIAYFFLLPNVCFPLFPVVDFKKFCRNYYDAERHRIYQVGVEWIWRGVVQLILYRLIYYHLTLDPVAVENVWDLALYMISTYAMYLRVSGQFHLVIGMLHLFGFNLPETNHRYFLASSFTDFWRRINIYWKDFMLKVFYYPAFFQLRKLGDTRALVLATAFTFLVTWFLHMVQWFWIRGSVFVEWNDIIFWSILGLLVMVNSVYEARHGRARTLSRHDRAWRESVGLVLRTAGTFVTLCVLWSFWSSESASDWLLMCRDALRLPPWSVLEFVLVIAALAVAIGAGVYGAWRGWGTGQAAGTPRYPAAAIVATSLALCVLTIPGLVAQVPVASDVLSSLRATSLNRRDAEEFQRGYYENLVDVRKFNDELGRIYEKVPADFVRSLDRAGLSRPTGDERGYELRPFAEDRFLGALTKVNSHGMRDREYAVARPPGVYRVAVVGPSTAMGSGVEEHEIFHTVLEDRLNRQAADQGSRYEVLNFGVAGYSPLQVLYQLERAVFAFSPDMLMYVGHFSDGSRVARQLTTLVQQGTEPRDGYLRDVVRRTGIRADMGPTELRRRMKPYVNELLAWTYGRIVAECTRRSVRPVFVYMETVTEPGQPWTVAGRVQALDHAHKAGFTIIDLTGAYESLRPQDLWIFENDGHPNVLGNRLLADRTFDLLRQHPELGLNIAR